MKKNIMWSNEVIPEVMQVLADGHVLIGTSDTVFGLLSLPTREGFEKLNTIKGRSDKPYLLLAGSVDAALDLCNLQHKDAMKTCMSACWPGPVTLILPAKESVPSHMKSKDNTIAVRVPCHEGLLALLAQVPYVFSTSANYSGDPVPHRMQELNPALVAQSPFVICDEDEVVTPSQPSTIIDCSVRPCKLVRQGVFSLQDLQEKCPDLF